jgi:predicted DNA repair protein MutK
VGGGIIAHGWHAAEVVLEGWAHATGPLAVVTKPVLDALLGVVCGAALVAVYTGVQKARGKH